MTTLRKSPSSAHHWLNAAKMNAHLAESKCNLSHFLTDTSEVEYLYAFKVKNKVSFSQII